MEGASGAPHGTGSNRYGSTGNLFIHASPLDAMYAALVMDLGRILGAAYALPDSITDGAAPEVAATVYLRA